MRWPLGLATFFSVTLCIPLDVLETQTHPLTRTAYDDNFARNSMLPLAGAAFSNTPQQCLTNIFQGTLKRQITVKCDGFDGDSCSGYTAVLPKQKAIVIAFRGTDAILQLIEEINEVFKAKTPFASGGNVNLYFYNAFLDVWNGGMKDDFLTLRNQYSGYELWITGHSLGAAMASLAAAYIVSVDYYDKNLIKLVTYGQPRTGDSTWAKWHDINVPYMLRITHSHDIVPHVPPDNMGYSHHKTEVWFKTDMKPSSVYIVCEDEDESSACSKGISSNLSTQDHLHYYEHHVSAYGQAGCTGDKMMEEMMEEMSEEENRGIPMTKKLFKDLNELQ